MRTRPLPALMLAAALVVAVAACGDDDGADTTTTAAATTTTVAETTTTVAATTTTVAATTTTVAETTTTMADDMGPADDVIEILVQGDRFSTDQIVLTAGQPVTIVVDDRDTETDEPHNFHVRTPSDDFFTEIRPAPNVQELTFTIDVPGTYEFFCDTHSNTMNGTVIVEEDM